MKRISISKKTRFEVFKRDSFTCQYCGKSSPDVVLEIDHVKPIIDGGDNSLLNLLTSCFDCNRGKGKKKLSDDSSVKKQQKQLKVLQEKNQQLKMLLEYRDSIKNHTEKEIEAVNSYFCSVTGYTFKDSYKKNVKSYIKKYGLNEVLESTEICLDQYFKDDESVDIVTKKLPKVLASRLKMRENPDLEEFYRISSYILNKVSYRDDWQSRKYLKDIFEVKGIVFFRGLASHIFYKNDIYDYYNDNVLNKYCEDDEE